MKQNIHNLFSEILNQITEIDYRDKVNYNKGEKITKVDYIVLSIEEILAITERLHFNLCQKDESIFIYNGEYWSVVNSEEFKSFLGEAALRMGVPFIQGKYYGFIDNLYKQFLASAKLPLLSDSQTSILINLRNGTFVFGDKGGHLKGFEKDDFLTYQLPFQYDLNATAPIFSNYLNTVLPDKALQLILAEYIGFIFTKGLKLEKCLLLYGNGANGKSVFFDIVNALLGKENITNYTLASLSEEHNRAMIAHKLLNYGSEIRGNIEADFFKQLVSGEPIHCRLKYGNPFICNNYARLMFNCNELPKQVEISNAYFRRFLIIPFDVTIPEAERDVELSKRIIESELSGIFNWVLDGLNRLITRKDFSQSETVKSIIEEYQIDSDSVALYLREEGIQHSNETVLSFAHLYDEYKQFCQMEGRAPVRRTKFSKRLKCLKFEFTRYSRGMMVNAGKVQEDKVSLPTAPSTQTTFIKILDVDSVESVDDKEHFPWEDF